jgi:GT2 family glycosyltransferase
MKVSVIIPFRSFSRLVEKCIGSVKRQTYRNVEIIAVSDRDEVAMPGVKSIKNSRLDGVGKKRNAGARVAEGDVLFFLDSDCEMRRDTVQKVVRMFGQIEADGITCKPLAPRDAGVLDFATLVEYEDRYDKVGENYVSVAATTCFAVKKKAFDKMRGFVDYTSGEATGEDWDFGMRMARSGYRIFHTNRIGVIHRHTSNGLWDYLKRQYMHARYRVMHKRRYVRYTDEYASTSMFITSTLLLCTPVIARTYKKFKDYRMLALIPISFLRSLMWLIGFVDGAFEKK